LKTSKERAAWIRGGKIFQETMKHNLQGYIIEAEAVVSGLDYSSLSIWADLQKRR